MCYKKKALRIVANVPKLSHTTPLFLKYKVLKLEDIVKFNVNIVMYKAFHMQLPRNLQCLFLKVKNVHSHKTRKDKKMFQKIASTNVKRMCLTIAGVKYWNELETDIKSCVSLPLFKSKLKSKYLNSYI